MRVIVPAMIISLVKNEYFGEMLNLVVPLPRLKLCGMYMQRAKADKASHNLTCQCNVYECLQTVNWFDSKPIPAIKTVLKSEQEEQIAVMTVLTTITNTSRLLFPRVKHGADDQEPRSDATFTYSENKTNGQEPEEVLASRMAT